jgi:nicotinate-nucleotide adenylyltransferase
MNPALSSLNLRAKGRGARIGIFGGSFNPVHSGHLKLAAFARSELNLDRLVFVPSRQSPIKPKADLLPAWLRVRLLRQAIAKRPGLSVSLCEMKRATPSYTVHTLRYFRKKFGPAAVLYFIAGADTLTDFSRWKSPAEVLKLCRFVVASRPGFSFKKTRWPFIWMPWQMIAVSSTVIRKRLRRGASVEGLVPSGTGKILRTYYKSLKKEV